MSRPLHSGIRDRTISLVVEQLGEQSASVGLTVDAPEGVEWVEPASVEVEGRAVSMRSRGVKFMELDFAHLAPHIFPVKAPPADTDTNSQARVIVYTLSGDFRPSESAILRFSFRTGDEVRELAFQDIPIP